MDTDLLELVIKNFIIGAEAIICYVILLRQDLRFNVMRTLACFALYSAASITAGLLTGASTVFLVADSVVFYAVMLLLLGRNRLCNYTAQALTIDMLSFFTSLLVALLYAVIGLTQGKISWLVLDQVSMGTKLLLHSMTIPAVILTLLTVGILRRDIMEITGPLRGLLVVLLPVKVFLLQLLKTLLTDTTAYRNNPSGIGYVIDIIDVILFLTVVVILLAHHWIHAHRAYRALQAREVSEQLQYRRQSEQLQGSLQQMRHDAAGWQQEHRK